MVINKDEFLSFLKKQAISGDFANDELMLNINKSKIKVLSVSNGKHAIIKGELSGSFEDIGEIALDNISNLISLISNFSSKEISITKKDNKLELVSDDDKIKSSFTLKNPEYVINKVTEDKFKDLYKKASGNEFKVSKSVISKIISTANSIKSNEISLKLKDKTMTISVDNGNQSIDIEFELDKAVKTASIKLNKAIIDILKMLNEETVISINNEAPVLFETSNVAYIVATLKK